MYIGHLIWTWDKLTWLHKAPAKSTTPSRPILLLLALKKMHKPCYSSCLTWNQLPKEAKWSACWHKYISPHNPLNFHFRFQETLCALNGTIIHVWQEWDHFCTKVLLNFPDAPQVTKEIQQFLQTFAV